MINDVKKSTELEMEEQAKAEEEAKKDLEAKATEPEPNVIYVGEFEPPKAINTGMLHIKLPAPADQADEIEVTDEKTGRVKKTYKGKPFYHKDASLLINTFSTLYKTFKQKGS